MEYIWYTAKSYHSVSLLSVVSKKKLVNNRTVNHLEICGFCISSMVKLHRHSYIISIAKTISKKLLGALIHSMKFHSPVVALYLYKSVKQRCMEYIIGWCS